MTTLHTNRNEATLSHCQHYFLLVKSVVRTKRRHLRRIFSVILALLVVIFVLKVQNQMSKLVDVRHTATKLGPQWILTKHMPADLEGVRARGHFAEFGVGLVKTLNLDESSLKECQEDNLGTRSNVPASIHQSLPLRPNEYQFPARSSPQSRRSRDQPWFQSSTHYSQSNKVQGEKFGSTAEISRLMLSPLTPGATFTSIETPADLFLTVLVISRPNHVLLRQATRQTWGQSARELGVTIRFVVGRHENWDDIIDRENHLHNDVIILEEEDTYDHLPNKVLFGISWLLHQSSTPRYVMKIDDDTIVNLPYLLHELKAGAINSSQIMGAICLNSTVIRDSRDKWAVSLLDYPFPTYPTYAFGGGYVMSTFAAAALAKARSRNTDWVHLEDVYITGILAMKSKITHVTHPAFAYWMTDKANACDFVQDKRITSVNHTEKEFYQLYSDIQDLLRSRNSTKCRNYK